MRVLLDTCALLWWAGKLELLTPRAYNLLESRDTQIFVSAVSTWEIAIKTRLGKLRGVEAPDPDIPALVRRAGFRELPISLDHGWRAGLLPGSHKDPFDRLLIAQAMAEDLAVVSSDRIFDEYHIRRIW